MSAAANGLDRYVISNSDIPHNLEVHLSGANHGIMVVFLCMDFLYYFVFMYT